MLVKIYLLYLELTDNITALGESTHLTNTFTLVHSYKSKLNVTSALNPGRLSHTVWHAHTQQTTHTCISKLQSFHVQIPSIHLSGVFCVNGLNLNGDTSMRRTVVSCKTERAVPWIAC